jgi:uncharacterized membrane protein
MDGLKKLMKALELKSDIINTVLGFVLIISLIFVYMGPQNKYAILLACIAGGLMNIMNGIKIIKDPIRKMTGFTFLLLGVVVIILGYIITQYFI